VQLAQLKSALVALGCTRLYVKALSPNDNSKNQVYLGPGFDSLHKLPVREIQADTRTGRSNFKAPLAFEWLSDAGHGIPAPNATLILYPRYPEVRLSGFLRGCASAPKALMTSRAHGRMLLLGVTPSGRIIACATDVASPLGASVRQQIHGHGVLLVELPLITGIDDRAALLAELKRVHGLGWINSKQLSADGNMSPCTSPNCGGYTLEAELGISKNGISDPDFRGFEVKQFAGGPGATWVRSKPITLLTPEPNGGIYASQGPVEFVRRFGYSAKDGTAGRWNFGGRHFCEVQCNATRCRIRLAGYDEESHKIADVSGSIQLISERGELAASWSFSKLLEHWSRKHARAVYVPSERQETPVRQYRFGQRVMLMDGTTPLLLLSAVASRKVYYDPGIKVETDNRGRSTKKCRSQFRIAVSHLGSLYERSEMVDVLA
jgi:hypothetical protein